MPSSRPLSSSAAPSTSTTTSSSAPGPANSNSAVGKPALSSTPSWILNTSSSNNQQHPNMNGIQQQRSDSPGIPLSGYSTRLQHQNSSSNSSTNPLQPPSGTIGGGPSLNAGNVTNGPPGLSFSNSGPAENKGTSDRLLSKDNNRPSELDRFGLNGLLGVVRMENNDLSMLGLGSDLTRLGLNLNSSEPLYSSFSSPWPEASTSRVEPEFHLPACYRVQSAPPQQTKIQNFSDETLFYIFYSMPRDVLQEAAAIELSNRNWRYHKELKLWLTKSPGAEPIQQSPQAERGIYTFFDPTTWERVKKEYVLYYHAIA